jgi:hypothetical protein
MSMLIDAYRFGVGSGGAYPTRLSTATQGFGTSATTSHNVNMPATVNTGDLLVVTLATRSDSSYTTPSGWNLVSGSQDAVVGQVKMATFYRVADGTEGGTAVNFVTASTSTAAASVRRYQAGTFTGTPEAAVATGGSATPDAPNLTPSWGSTKCDWIVSCAIVQGTAVSAYPYATDNAFQNSGGTGTTQVSQATCSTQVDAASLNPGTFSISGGSVRNWVASTVAIRGT